MTGETNLSTLIRQMQPQLNEGIYVFCSVSEDYNIPVHEVLSSFWEKEGLSLLLSKPVADRYQIPYTFEASWITLNIHSALEAVGLTAAVATALTKSDISCNIVAAYYHDHIFVEKTQAEEALEVLEALSRQ